MGIRGVLESSRDGQDPQMAAELARPAADERR
jgi:hypothetical protein